MDVTVHTVRNFSMYDRDVLYEMQKKLISLYGYTTQCKFSHLHYEM